MKLSNSAQRRTEPSRGASETPADNRPAGARLPRWYTEGGLPRAGVIHNPHSGRNAKRAEPLGRLPSSYPAVPFKVVQTAQDVSRALDDFHRHGIDLVAIDGGDGTMHAALSALFRHPEAPLPTLAVLRSGTTSAIAGDVGLRGARQKALGRLLAWASGGTGSPDIVRRAVIGMETGDGTPARYGMFFGAGAIYQGICYTRRHVHPLGLRGEIGPGLALGRFLLAMLRGNEKIMPAVNVSAVIDGRPLEARPSLLVMVSTLERLLLGTRPYWGEGPGGLHYTQIHARPRHLLRTLPSLLRGRGARHASADSGYVSSNADLIELGLTGGFALDGELFSLGPARIVLRNAGEACFLRL